MLWTPAASRREVFLQLPPSYFTIQEGDVLTFTDNVSKPWRILVQQVDRGAQHLVKIEGIEEVSALMSFTSIADDPKHCVPILLETREGPGGFGDLR